MAEELFIRARGRIDPPNLAERHVEHVLRHGDKQAIFAAEVTIPATFDVLNLCTPIKNQESCGSCWDFSGTCMIEGANIKAGVLPDNSVASQLSEQFTLDQCDGANGGCRGDDNTTVLADAKSGGLPLTSAYGPYEARGERCKIKPASLKLYTIDDWGYVGSQTGVAPTPLIKAAMMQYGPIGSGIAADGAFENYQPGTVFNGNARGINHDIVLVGWDDTKQAWLLRNSWDVTWGNKGYMWIAYGANQVGYEAVWASKASVNPPVPDVFPGPPPLSSGWTSEVRISTIRDASESVSAFYDALLAKGVRFSFDASGISVKIPE